MASRLQQLLNKAKSAVEPAYNSMRSQAVKQYETTMAKNAEFVVQDEAKADKLLKQWSYTRLSRLPAGIQHSEQEAAVMKQKLQNFKDLPVPEMAQYVGFAAEIYAWFVIGEIVGRGGSLTGYSV